LNAIRQDFCPDPNYCPEAVSQVVYEETVLDSLVSEADRQSGGIAPSAQNSAGIPRGAMTLLMLVYMFNMLDRQILTILAEPIKADLGLADWQIGAISGLAFALLYTIGGIPLSRIADRGDRVRMISAAVAVWSAFTIVCGFARSFADMLLARVGVGVGEAGCTPAAHSLITDYVPREKRASALAFYQLGTPLGALTGLIVGGFVLSVLNWRWAFFLAGAPGLLLAIIVLLVLKEPRRYLNNVPGGQRNVTWRASVVTLMAKKSFWCICLASAFAGFAYFGQSSFLGSLYLRTHNEELARLAETMGMAPTSLLGILLGVMVGIGGGAGTLVGGWFADRMSHQGVRGYLSVAVIAMCAAAPMYICAPLVNDMKLSLVLIGGAMFAHSLSFGPTYATIQTIAMPQMRGMAVALQILFVNGVGLALGPLMVGGASDLLNSEFGAIWSLRFAMSLGTLPIILAALLFALCLRYVDGDHAD
jgi:MFS family permease